VQKSGKPWIGLVDDITLAHTLPGIFKLYLKKNDYGKVFCMYVDLLFEVSSQTFSLYHSFSLLAHESIPYLPHWVARVKT
jgi:hypothetical protein